LNFDNLKWSLLIGMNALQWCVVRVWAISIDMMWTHNPFTVQLNRRWWYRGQRDMVKGVSKEFEGKQRRSKMWW
jgi:hypothetical protein